MRTANTTVSTIDSSIKRARVASQLTLRELALRLGVTAGAVSQMERSEARGSIRLDTLRRALDAIGSTTVRPAPFDRREDRVAFELHRAVAKKLIDDPDGVRAVIPANLVNMRARVHGPLAERWLDRWELLATAPVGQLIDVMLATDDEAKELRQNSPFAGALTQEERLDAIRRAAR